MEHNDWVYVAAFFSCHISSVMGFYFKLTINKMDYKKNFKDETGYDAYAYDENDKGEPRVIGFCENYVEWLEAKTKRLQHHKDTTVGLWATDRPDLVKDKKKILFQIN